MKKLLIIIMAILILLLGGGGTAAYLGYLPIGYGDDALAASSDTPLERIAMDPFVLPMIRRGALKGQITLNITVEVRPGRDKLRVWRMQPILRDAFIKDLHALLPLKLDDPDFVKSDYMRKRLLGIAEKVIGRGYVRTVTIYTMRTAI